MNVSPLCWTRVVNRVSILIEFPADGRHPTNAYSLAVVVVAGGVHHSVDMDPYPPAVGGRLLTEPNVVGEGFSLPDRQRGRRHLHFPLPVEDRGVVLGVDLVHGDAGQERRQHDGGGDETRGSKDRTLFQSRNGPEADK